MLRFAARDHKILHRAKGESDAALRCGKNWHTIVTPPMAAGRQAGLASGILAVAMLAGCTNSLSTTPPSASAAETETLNASNETTIAVTLVVNGLVVETIAPGDREEPITAPMPALPWSVEARSPSGHVLAALDVRAGDVAGSHGRAVRTDLSCGRLDLWAGPPLLGGTFIPGPSGDCD